MKSRSLYHDGTRTVRQPGNQTVQRLKFIGRQGVPLANPVQGPSHQDLCAMAPVGQHDLRLVPCTMQDEPRAVPRPCLKLLQEPLDQLLLRLEVGARCQSLGASAVTPTLALTDGRYAPKTLYLNPGEDSRDSEDTWDAGETPGVLGARAQPGPWLPRLDSDGPSIRPTRRVATAAYGVKAARSVPSNDH